MNHFRSGKSSFFHNRGKVKNNNNKKMQRRVGCTWESHDRWRRLNFVGENNRLPEHSSRSASSISSNRLGYRKVCPRRSFHIWTPQQTRDTVAYLIALLKICENCNPRRLDELVTGDVTWLCYFWTFEKSNERSKGTEMWGRTPNCGGDAAPWRKYVTKHFWGPCATEATESKTEHHRGAGIACW